MSHHRSPFPYSPAPSLGIVPPLSHHLQRESLYAPVLLRSCSSNPVAEVPEEALEVVMLAGKPTLGPVRGGHGGAELFSTETAAGAITRGEASTAPATRSTRSYAEITMGLL